MKNRSLYRILAALLAVLMISALAACGKEETTSGSDNAKPTTSSSEPVASSTEPTTTDDPGTTATEPSEGAGEGTGDTDEGTAPEENLDAAAVLGKYFDAYNKHDSAETIAAAADEIVSVVYSGPIKAYFNSIGQEKSYLNDYYTTQINNLIDSAGDNFELKYVIIEETNVDIDDEKKLVFIETLKSMVNNVEFKGEITAVRNIQVIMEVAGAKLESAQKSDTVFVMYQYGGKWFVYGEAKSE